MAADWAVVGSIADIVRGVGKGLKEMFSTWGMKWRNRKSKKRQKDSHEAVENGDVDAINDILSSTDSTGADAGGVLQPPDKG